MKKFTFFALILGMLAGCKETETIELAACSDPELTRSKKFENVETFVKALTIDLKSGTKQTVYYMQNPDYSDNTAIFAACNLPAQCKKDNLKVRISGYILFRTGSENMNSFGLPVEITAIEIR